MRWYKNTLDRVAPVGVPSPSPVGGARSGGCLGPVAITPPYRGLVLGHDAHPCPCPYLCPWLWPLPCP